MVEPGTPSLQEAVTSCSWRLEVIGADPGEVGAAVERLLDADQLVVTRERKGRDVTEDLRPALLDLALLGPTPSGTELVAELATQPRALRPAELVAALVRRGLPGASARAGCAGPTNGSGADGGRREPLPSPPGSTAGRSPRTGRRRTPRSACVVKGLTDVRRTHQPRRAAAPPRPHPAAAA